MTSKTATIYDWVDERLGLSELAAFARHKTVPVHAQSFWYYWGGISLFLFLVQCFTGVLLLVYFRPGAESYESVRQITFVMHFGWLIRSAHEWGVKRLIYENPQTHIKIDVFMDELVMAHTIHFKGRLDLGYPTIGLADLLLSKLQIHQVTENDFIDLIVLLAEHDVGSGDRERIDMPYILEVLRNDWGFTYTALDNLKKTQQALGRYELPAEAAENVRTRIAAITGQIEAAPKSTRWKLRARVGTRSKWYEDVDEVHR